jgi:hypothetical protein
VATADRMNTACTYTVRALRTMEEVEGARDAWRAMQNHPNTDYDFYRLIVSSRANVLGPYVLMLSRRDDVVAMLIGRRESVRLECRFGYKVLFRPRMKSITILEGGYFGPDDAEAACALVEHLLGALRARQADVVMFAPLPVESQLYRAVQAMPSRWCRNHLAAPTPHYSVLLPDTPEAFVARMKPKHRGEIRRWERGLAKNHGQVTLKRLNQPGEVEQLCRDVEVVAAKTYHRRLGFGFVHDEEMVKRLKLTAGEGRLRTEVLYVAGEPKAFWTATLYKGVCYLDYTGYDPAFKQYRMGTLVLLKLFQDLCGEEIARVDCGQGGAQYKARFGEEEHQESEGIIFAPTLNGVAFNLTRTAIHGLALSTKRLLARLGTLDKVKKYWRFKKIAAGSPTSETEENAVG